MRIKNILLSTFAIIALGSWAIAQESKPAESSETTVKRERGVGQRGFAKEGGKRHGKRGGFALKGLKKLNLSEAQEIQTKAIFENYKTRFQPVREELKNLVSKKRDGIISLDEEARLKQLKTELRDSSKQMQTEIMNVLTDEQKNQLKQMREEKRQRMQERRQNRQMNLPQEKPQDN